MAETLKGIMEKAVKKYREVYAAAAPIVCELRQKTVCRLRRVLGTIGGVPGKDGDKPCAGRESIVSIPERGSGMISPETRKKEKGKEKKPLGAMVFLLWSLGFLLLAVFPSESRSPAPLICAPLICGFLAVVFFITFLVKIILSTPIPEIIFAVLSILFTLIGMLLLPVIFLSLSILCYVFSLVLSLQKNSATGLLLLVIAGFLLLVGVFWQNYFSQLKFYTNVLFFILRGSIYGWY